jgi:hypothetical protein
VCFISATNGFYTSPSVTILATPFAPSTIPNVPIVLPLAGYLTTPSVIIGAGIVSYIYFILEYSPDSFNMPSTLIGKSYIVLGWIAPANGGSPITAYRISVLRAWAPPSAARTYMVSALSNETAGVTRYIYAISATDIDYSRNISYAFSVQSYNSNGYSILSLTDSYAVNFTWPVF